MTGNEFNLGLNDFLNDFLFDYLGWDELNPVQKETIPLILNQKDTLVIAPTASGKTEAVLIPIFNDLIINNLEPVNVLYISPLKALINDMDKRIQEWGRYFGFTSSKWHGDVSAHKKKCFINNPTDFLSITPESLEVILMNKSTKEKKTIFSNIKYVIIDEIHYFVESDRGTQLNSLINRISKYSNNKFIKIGLSATVGNPQLVAEWLNNEKPAEIVNITSNTESKFNVVCGDKKHITQRLYKYVNKKKILIFTQSRKEAEKYDELLKKQLKYEKIYIHHSSIDRKTREKVENNFKNEPNAFMISTSTLELGIDIGNIYAVVQIKPPNTVSSNLQRMGRSGRTKDDVSRSIIFYQNDSDIFISLSEIILIKEKNVENIHISEKPLDIYFHQILSTVIEYMKIDKNELYYHLKDCYSFSRISFEEYKNMIWDMEKKNLIKKDKKYITIGPAFEEKFGKLNFLNFYSVFYPSYEYAVKDGNTKIGTLDPTYSLMLKKGSTFILSGSSWIVKDINYKKFLIKVAKINTKENKIPKWSGDGPTLSYEISRQIYSILLNEYDKKILEHIFDEKSKNKINKYVQKSEECGFRKGIIPIEFNQKTRQIYIYTFAGHKVNVLLSFIYKICLDITSIDNTAYYTSFKIQKGITIDEVFDILTSSKKILENNENKIEIYKNLGNFYKNKFINLIPEEYSLKLKFDILFDEINLIKLTEENEPVLCQETNIKKWL